MDPNTALANLRSALDRAERAANEESNDAEIEAWQEVRELTRSLDDWLSGGGFLPSAWDPPQERRDGELTFTRH
jgi:hypothetical protein